MEPSFSATLRAPERLVALHRSGLLDTLPEESFDRLTRLAARFLDAPVALVTLIDQDRQFFKSAVGLGEPWASKREMPLAYSYCQHALASSDPLVIEDARLDPRTQNSPAIAENRSLAYAGVPLTAEGQVLGTLCVVDSRPRRWTEDEIATLRDLAASAQTEIDLRREAGRRAEHAAALDATHDSIIVRDLEDRITLWSRGAEERYGWSGEEAKGRITHELLLTRFPVPMAQIRAELLRDGRWEGDLVHTTRDGEEVVVASRWAVQRDERGEPAAILETNQDVTEHRRAQEALRASEERFRQLFESSMDGVFITERDGTMVDVNEAVLRLTGYSREEIRQINAAETYADPADRERFRELLEREGAVQNFEVKVRRKDGSTFDAIYSATVRRNEAGDVLGYQGIVHDITDRKRVEKALEESEQRFRQLSTATNEAVFLTEKGVVVDVNEAAARMFRFDRVEEMIGRPALDFAAPESRPLMVERIHSGYSEPYEMSGLRQGGDRFPIEAQGGTAVFQGREVRVTTIRDLTERKRAEEALRESEERFRTVVESLAEAIIITDRDDRIVYANSRNKEITGYTPEELLGRLDTETLVLPEDRDSFRTQTHHRLQGRLSRYEVRQLRKNGEPIWVEVHASPLRNSAGEIVGTVGAVTDITERRRIEEALEKSEAKFRSLIENASDMITVMDATGTMHYETPTAMRVLGYAPGELLDRSFVEFTHPEDVEPMVELFQRVLQRPAEPMPWRLRFRHRNGSYRWLEGVSTNLLEDPAVGGVVANSRDVTERIEAEKKLEAYSRELERSNRELQDFAYIASHDLQEPLRKVQAFSDRLKGRYAEVLDDTGRDYLDRMQNAASRMQVLIEDLLTYSRVTSKAHPFERIDLNEVAAGVVRDLSTRVERTGARVTLGALPEVDADPLQMRQLFQNLIANALKFHREGVPPVVTASGEARREFAEIRVTDNGIGFEMEYAERMFRPFERLHGRLKFEGTGMGLAIVRKIVERHGGSIHAESTPGEGATFVVRLPRRQNQTEDL